MTALIVIFLILSAGGLLCSAAFGRRYEDALPLTCTAIVLILLLAGVAGLLPAGVYAVYLTAVAAYVFSFFNIIRKHSWKETAHRLFTPGFVIFAVAFVLFAVCNKGKLVHEMDSFSHWGDVVKSMTLLDDFGTNAASLTEFKSYPPGISLFQYFYEKTGSVLHGGTVFTEWYLYHAYQVMLAAFVAPVFSKLNHRKPAAGLICAVCVFAAPMVMYYNTYDSLYVDSLLGILSGCAMAMMICYERDDKTGYLNILSAIVMMVLIKDAGLLFAVFATVSLIFRQMTGEKNSIRPALLLSAGGIAAAAIPKLLWELELFTSGAPRQFAAKIDAAQFLNVILHRDGTYRETVFGRYIEDLILKSVEFRNLGVNITYLALMLMLFIALYYLIVYSKKPKQDGRIYRTWWLWIQIAEMAVYLIGLCAAYMFKFKDFEALKLDSFDRYVRIAFQAVWITMILILARRVQESDRLAYRLVLLGTVIASVPIGPSVCFLTRDNVSNSIEERAEFIPMTQKIEQYAGEDRPVFIIEARHDFGYAYRGLRYIIRPIPTQSKNITIWCLGGPNNSEEGEYSAEEWQKELLAYYDYVAVYATDEYFVEHFSELFSDPSGPEDGAIYAVNRTTGLLDKCE
ncbi:MAG: hypothetical protein II000_07010 [Clostridia bacterium]|nr:hypothetical protein [Clostridia bacterium]